MMGYILGVLGALLAVGIAMWAMAPKPVKPAVLTGKAVQLVFVGKGGAATGGFGDESVTQTEDIRHTVEKEIDWPAVLEADFARLSPYTIDYDNARVVVVELEPADLEDKNVTFFYQAQRKNMLKAYAIPIDQFASSMQNFMNKLSKETVAQTLSQTLFLFSTGRCGSTLLSKLLAQVGGTKSLHEPDIFTAVTIVKQIPNMQSKLTKQQMDDVLRYSTWMLAHATRLNHPEVNFVEIKLRSYCMEIAETIKKVVPESKNLFLYRNAIDTIDSFCVAFANSGIATAIRVLHLDSLFFSLYPAVRNVMPLLAPLASDSRFSASDQTSMGAVGMMTMMWLSVMDRAVVLTKKDPTFFNIIVRYEDLVVYRTKIVKEIAVRCKMSSEDVPEDRVSAVFDEDAHIPTSKTASKRGADEKPLYIRDADYAGLQRLLSSHEIIKAGDYIIEGTYTL